MVSTPIYSANGDHVASVCVYGEQSETPGLEREHAALISAAPDLLAACQHFEDLTRNGCYPGTEDLQMLQAAIAKATGAV